MIHNIHILIEDDSSEAIRNRQFQAQAALQVALVEAHRRGEHPWGSMRRECPLCQEGK